MAIPTFFMGATLPILSAGIISQGSGFTKTLGYLYGLNTLGAMFGVFISAYITLGSIGEFNTVLLGCFFNLLAGTVFLLANKQYMEQQSVVAVQNPEKDIPLVDDYPAKTRNLALFTYCIIGFISFALEVVWVRLFQLSLGTAIYAFSTVMIIYLGGSAIGSYACSKYFGKLKAPVETLGLILVGLGLYILVGLYLFGKTLPWYISVPLIKFSLLHSKVVLTPLIIFPITFSLGFIFPLVSRVYVNSKEKTSSGIGKLYSANTIGCIIGSLFCGYIFIPYLGTRLTMLLLSVAGCILGAIVLFMGGNVISKSIKSIVTLGTVIIIVSAFLLIPDPFLRSLRMYEHGNIWYHKEASDATITVCGYDKEDHGGKELFINGTSMTYLQVETKIMAHLPLLLHPDPKNMLVVCYGMGTCLRSAVTHSDVNCDVVELIGEEFEVGDFFHSNAKEVLQNKRVRHFADDGRNFLLMHDKKYDVITIDPAPPIFSAGTVNLYSKDFFILCHQRLTSNGILCLWIPPSGVSEVKMIMKSYQAVFPNTYVYRAPTCKGLYMVGYMNYSPPSIARFDSATHDSAIMADLNEWSGADRISPSELPGLKTLSPSQLAAFITGEKEVSDNHPYTEFPLWRKWYAPADYNKILDISNL